MEADFSGYATKAGLKCSDGRTIMPDAFKHQDTMKVPLVWQHGHTDPENVLGHVLLENRVDGVYAYGFFNGTDKAKHTKDAVEHKDITMMSIWANDLIERAKHVLHGAIREVSLVLSGANPGAVIENVTIRHSQDGEDDVTLDDEAIIYTGLTFDDAGVLVHKDDKPGDKGGELDIDKKESQEVFDSMTDEQQELVHSLVADALAGKEDGKEVIDHAAGDNETVQDVYDTLSDKQKQVLHYMIGQALQDAGGSMGQDNLENNEVDDTKKGDEMKHNVFEDQKDDTKGAGVLAHADIEGIIASAVKGGSLKDAVEEYALSHGITDIDILFPDAVNLDSTPQFLARRVEWVGVFLGATRKSPFSRIKSIAADITLEEARAKGYVKGTLKKEEFFGVTRRVTTPTTIYKKQKLDRDDVIDISDFDVVVWLKSEMRLMLDEELARAALMGDGRDIANDDKINEQNIRPIASEHELFATQINVNLDDASSSVSEIVDAVIMNRKYYKGTGTPTFFTSETYISKFMLLKDGVGRRIYKNLDEVAADLRVSAIVPCEAMEDDDTLIGVIVNPVDYVIGATRGGEVSFFDQFDIDYNQQKYLIETRVCGALVKLKSALVLRKVTGTDTLVSPAAPTFNAATGALTIVNQTGVVYKNAETNAVVNAAGSPYSVDPGDSISIVATPASTYYFATSENDEWTFTAE